MTPVGWTPRDLSLLTDRQLVLRLFEIKDALRWGFPIWHSRLRAVQQEITTRQQLRTRQGAA